MPDSHDSDLDAPSTDRPPRHAAGGPGVPSGSGRPAGSDSTASGSPAAHGGDTPLFGSADFDAGADPADQITPPAGLPAMSGDDEQLFAGVDGPPHRPRPDANDDVSDGSSDEEPARGRSSTMSFFRELPVLLLVAFVLAFLLRTFIVQVFYIPSSSMEPTLRIDDRMVVEKITYRFRDPVRGEVVVFEGEDFSTSNEEAALPTRIARGIGQFLGVVPASARDFVKRVVGLPGDEILIEGGQVYVNGEPLDEPYVVYDDGSDFGPVTVPPDALFFLGDNRPNSSDSRRSLGYVPMDAVVGRAAYIIWPFDHARSLMGVEHDVPDAPAGGAARSSVREDGERSYLADPDAEVPGAGNDRGVADVLRERGERWETTELPSHPPPQLGDSEPGDVGTTDDVGAADVAIDEAA